MSALSACLDREQRPNTGRMEPREEGRQYAWNEYLEKDRNGSPIPPEHQVILTADYIRDGTPSDEERRSLERALRDLEDAYEESNEGLLFVVGYSPSYFDRYDGELPDEVALPEPQPLASFEEPNLDDDDLVMHLASDRANAVLAAEEALFGDADEANGTEVRGVSDILRKTDRRTGFVGEGLPAENQDVDGIPDSEPVHEDAPLYMGFHSLHATNQATEEFIAIQDGAFEDGTTMHLSKILLELEDWYDDLDQQGRVRRMFTARTPSEEIGETGQDAQTSEDPRNLPPDLRSHAEEYGVVGHGGKASRGRRGEERRPVLLRRDFNTTDEGHAGVHFASLQREISDFVAVREGMNGTDLTDIEGIGERENNGILSFMEVTRRANFLVPPLQHRAFPTPNPEG